VVFGVMEVMVMGAGQDGGRGQAEAGGQAEEPDQ
jgi:hypothetical protein